MSCSTVDSRVAAVMIVIAALSSFHELAVSKRGTRILYPSGFLLLYCSRSKVCSSHWLLAAPRLSFSWSSWLCGWMVMALVVGPWTLHQQNLVSLKPTQKGFRHPCCHIGHIPLGAAQTAPAESRSGLTFFNYFYSWRSYRFLIGRDVIKGSGGHGSLWMRMRVTAMILFSFAAIPGLQREGDSRPPSKAAAGLYLASAQEPDGSTPLPVLL